MKNIFRILFATLFAVMAIACSDEKEAVEPELDVNNANIAGTWERTSWNNEPSADGTYVYITFDRKEQTFVMYQNIDSFDKRKVTGAYAIDMHEEFGAIIRGTYDYGNGDWGSRYIITNLTKDRMVWTKANDRGDVTVYTRSSVPDDIANSTDTEE